MDFAHGSLRVRLSQYRSAAGLPRLGTLAAAPDSANRCGGHYVSTTATTVLAREAATPSIGPSDDRFDRAAPGASSACKVTE